MLNELLIVERGARQAGIEVAPLHVAVWGIPTALTAFCIHAWRLHRLDRKLAADIAAELNATKAGA